MFGGTIKLNRYGVIGVLCLATVILLYRWNSPSTRDHAITFKRLLIESIWAAERGGAQVTRIHQSANLNAKSKGLTKEGAQEPVTDADLRSHQAMRFSLNSAFKGHNIKLISEEHSTDDKTVDQGWMNSTPDVAEAVLLAEGDPVDGKDVTIWIDPLDATQEFTEDLLQYVTILVCVAVKGKPVIGVVHKPFQHETVWAWVGHGHSTNIRISDKNEAYSVRNNTPVIIVSRSHAGEVKEVAKQAFGDDVQIVPAGGAGYKVLEVISGRADAYVHVTLIKKWDICAGNAILDAVGGRMTTLTGEEIDYTDGHMTKNEHGLVATMRDHRKFLDALKQLE